MTDPAVVAQQAREALTDIREMAEHGISTTHSFTKWELTHGLRTLLADRDALAARVSSLTAEKDTLRAAEQRAIRVTWHNHEPKLGESRADLLVLLNRGDWSVPWVRREVASLVAESQEAKQLREVLRASDALLADLGNDLAGTDGEAWIAHIDLQIGKNHAALASGNPSESEPA